MSRRDKRRKPILVAGRGPYGGLAYQMVQYLAWWRERHASEDTLNTRENVLSVFLLWCEERGLLQAQDLSLRILERYQRHLYQYRKSNGEPLGISTQISYLSNLKSFFSWLTRRHLISANPAAELELPKQGTSLLKDVLSHDEVEQLMAYPDVNTVRGLRDRALLEVMYNTGIRRMELCNLTLNSIHHENGTVMIRKGKGKKDRLIPVGERARYWVKVYQAQARPALCDVPESDRLFLATEGQGFSTGGLSAHITRLIKESGVREKGSCHLLRHSMATQMLEHGADTRWIQAMLGHACLGTTQIYTQVSIKALREIHGATHPAELAYRARNSEQSGEDSEVGLLADLNAGDIPESATAQD